MVTNLLNSKCDTVAHDLSSALLGHYEQSYNGAAPGGASIGNTATWRAGFWTALDKWSNTVTTQYNQVHVLHRTLARKRDLASQRSLLEECDLTPIQTYVQTVYTALQQELRNLNSSAKQALNMEYPKALRLIVAMWNTFNSKLDLEGLEDVKLPKFNVS